jgi:hypothetical protein
MATECEYLVPALRQNITILSQNWDGIIKVVQPINYIMSLILSLNCDVIFFSVPTNLRQRNFDEIISSLIPSQIWIGTDISTVTWHKFPSQIQFFLVVTSPPSFNTETEVVKIEREIPMLIINMDNIAIIYNFSASFLLWQPLRIIVTKML